jgi:large subunit ribosomal protein L7Ae
MTDKTNEILEIIEIARETGNIRKGINETTKALERGKAKLVVIATDVDPPEITMHIPVLCKEKNVRLEQVPSKMELGRAAGIDVSTTAVVIVEPGEAKKRLSELK